MNPSDTDDTFDMMRALIHEHGLRDAQRIMRGIARGLDALRALHMPETAQRRQEAA